MARMWIGSLVLTGAALVSAPLLAQQASRLIVERINAPQYDGASGDPLENACATWRLSPAQVEAFFRHSTAFDTMPVTEFYQLPCAISGALLAGGERWDFVIDGGATASWRNAGGARYWGCMARDCEALVLLPYDGMSGGL